MDSEQIATIWSCFKEYLDKKQVDMAAEKYVDLLADYGVDELVLKEALGSDDALDTAIEYYLDLEHGWDD